MSTREIKAMKPFHWIPVTLLVTLSICGFADEPSNSDANTASQGSCERSTPNVLAYYYPWYIKGDWSRHDYVGTPELGEYGTDAPVIAEQHIDWCANHGIDGLFVSWWGRKHLTNEHLNVGFLQASNIQRIKFALFYESLGLLDSKDGKSDGICDFSNPAVIEAMTDDFQYLKDNYFDHPRYLKLSGRPIVGMYVTRTFRNFTRDHLDQVREAIGSNVFLIADEAFIGRQASPATAVNGPGIFDAYTAYNLFEDGNVRGDDTALTFQSREALPIFRTWAAQTPFIPAVFPTYEDFRGHKPLPGNSADFATLLNAASDIATPLGSSTPPIVLITSFNEWWEGTTIEPTTEYQKEYLQVIQRFKMLSQDSVD